MTRAMGLAAAVVLLAGTGTFGKEPGGAALEEAKALAAKGDALGAAGRFGDAVAAAHAAGDLQAEQAAANALAEWFGALRTNQSKSAAKRADTVGDAALAPPSRATLLAGVLSRLDPDRCGAFVAAPVLARNVFVLSTMDGDLSGVAVAMEVAQVHATRASSGRSAAVVARYGAGLTELVAGRFEAAAGTLDRAAAEAAEARWVDIAAFAGTEAAVAWTRAGKHDHAAASLSVAVDAVRYRGSGRFAADWRELMSKRLADAPASVREPADGLPDWIRKQTTQPGLGGRGQQGWSTPETPVVTWLRSHDDAATFVGAKRHGRRFVVSFQAPVETRDVVELDTGVGYESCGGVTLGFCRGSVGLADIQFPGPAKGGSGGRGSPSPIRAYYLLAEGETWNVAKDGVVTITR